MKLSPDQQECWFGLSRFKLEEKFGEYEYRDINFGCQLIFKTGEIVNLYETGKFAVGGRGETGRFKDAMFKIKQMFEETII